MFIIPKTDKATRGPLSRCHSVLHADPQTYRPDNLIEAAHDVLVAGKIIADDNYTIIASVDGSRVLYDKSNPRTEIFIEEMEDETT